MFISQPIQFLKRLITQRKTEENENSKMGKSIIEAFFTNERISIPAHSKDLLKYINIYIYYIHFKSKI